jgi:hypothetical protein
MLVKKRTREDRENFTKGYLTGLKEKETGLDGGDRNDKK